MLGATHDVRTVEGTAHELMHCVQYEYGQGGQTIFNEVEAYVLDMGLLRTMHQAEEKVSVR